MPRKNKNPKGGKKHKQKASKDFRDNFNGRITYKDSKVGQEYAIVIQRLGGNRLLVKSIVDKNIKEVQAVIPGSFRKKVWMKDGDLILIQARSFNESQYDIIHKYNEREEKQLKKTGALEQLFENEEKLDDDDYGQVQFTDRNDCDEEKQNKEEVQITYNNENDELDIDFDEI